MTSGGGKTRPHDFSQLLRESKELVDQVRAPTHIMRSAPQLELLARRFAQAGPAPSSQAESRSQIFLAGKGIDLKKGSQMLRRVDLTKSFEPFERIHDLDVGKFLDHQHIMLMNTAVEECSSLTAKEFRSWYSEVMENDWEMAKKSMLNSFGFENVAEYQHDRSMMANPPTQTPMKPRSFVPASEGREQKVPPVASKNQLYGECVRRIAFDRAAPDSRNINVISTFLEMRQKLRDDQRVDFSLLWDLLNQIVVRGSGLGSLKEKQFAQAQRQGQYKKNLIQGAISYCEMMMKRNNSENQSSPSLAELAKTYTAKMQHVKRETTVWVEIMVGLQCGMLTEAANLAKERRMSALAQCLEYMSHNRMELYPDELWKQLVQEYQRSRGESKDEHLLLVYNVVGCCDPKSHPYKLLTTSIEDYLWYWLSMVRFEKLPQFFNMDAHAKSAFSLRALQERTQADAQRQDSLDCYLSLMLTLQFDEAMHHLLPVVEYCVDAVHLVIALNYYGLINTPRDEETGLDLHVIIQKYTEGLKTRDTELAICYLSLLAPIGERKLNLMGEPQLIRLLQNLTLETKEYDILFGARQGARYSEGLLVRFFGENAKLVASEAAKVAERRGESFDAITLASFAEDFEFMGTILMEKLSHISKLPWDEASVVKFREAAERFIQSERVNKDGQLLKFKDTITKQLCVLRFLDLVNRGPARFNDAQLELARLDLFPLSATNEQVVDTRQKAEDYKRFRGELKSLLNLVPEVLMHILVSEYKNASSGRARSSGQQEMIRIKNVAQALKQFVAWANLDEIGARLSRLMEQMT